MATKTRRSRAPRGGMVRDRWQDGEGKLLPEAPRCPPGRREGRHSIEGPRCDGRQHGPAPKHPWRRLSASPPSRQAAAGRAEPRWTWLQGALRCLAVSWADLPAGEPGLPLGRHAALPTAHKRARTA